MHTQSAECCKGRVQTDLCSVVLNSTSWFEFFQFCQPARNHEVVTELPWAFIQVSCSQVLIYVSHTFYLLYRDCT